MINTIPRGNFFQYICLTVFLLSSASWSNADQNSTAEKIERLQNVSDVSIHEIMNGLEDADHEVREMSVMALELRWQEAPDPAIDGLIKALQDKNSTVRMRAVFALGGIGPAAKQSIPYLIKALKDPNPDVRIRSADALSGMGLEARVALPALQELLSDPFEFARLSADDAIRKIKALEGGASEDPVLTAARYQKAADDTKKELIFQLNKPASELIQSLGSSSLEDRLDAVNVLGMRAPFAIKASELSGLLGFSPEIKPLTDAEIHDAVLGLTQLLKIENDSTVRMGVVSALGNFGPFAEEAAPELLNLAKQGDEDMVFIVDQTLKRIRAGADELNKSRTPSS